MKNSKVKEVIFKAFIMALKLKYFIRANTFLGNKHRVTHSNSHQTAPTRFIKTSMTEKSTSVRSAANNSRTSTCSKQA